MRTKLALAGIVVAAGFAAFATPSHADTAAFGVSPAEIKFVTPPAVRGQEYGGVLKISNRQTTPAAVTVTPEGPSASWLTIIPGSPFVMEPNTVRDLVVKLRVPDNASNGDYVTKLRVRAAAPNVTASSSGSGVSVELVPIVRARVSGDQVVAFTLETLAVRDASAGQPVEIVSRILNSGNVRASPFLAVTVTDASGAKVLDEVLPVGPRDPRDGSDLSLFTDGLLPAAGEYRLTARLFLGEESFGTLTTPFTAAVAGSTKPLPQGRLVTFGTDGVAVPGRPLKLEARFANTGRETIDAAKFTGEILRAGSLVAAVASDPLRIPKGVEESLVAYWTPTESGTFTLRGFVVFDGLRVAIPEQTIEVGSGAASTNGDAGGSSSSTNGGSSTTGGSATKETPNAPAKGIPGPGLLALASLGALAARASRRR